MKIQINKIDEGRFVIREENNKEYIDQLSQSLLADGQWNPIILRPKEGGRYEIIAGHYRLKAAKKAKFKEIEASVRDLTDEEADVLSIKTNLIRLEMTAREQGHVLSKMMERYGWSQRNIAKELNVGVEWVSRRLSARANYWGRVYLIMGATSIIFSVSAGTSLLYGSQELEVVAGIFALFSSIIIAISTFIKPNKQEQDHARSGSSFISLYYNVRVFCEVESIIRMTDDEKEIISELHKLIEKRDEIDKTSPRIPKGTWSKAKIASKKHISRKIL